MTIHGAVEATRPPRFSWTRASPVHGGRATGWHNHTMAFVRWIVVAVAFVALLYLSLQNSEKATLRFFNIAQWEAPLVVVVFIAFACGVAAGLLAGALRATRLKRQLNRLRREQRASADPRVRASGPAPGTTPASGPGFARDEHVADGL